MLVCVHACIQISTNIAHFKYGIYSHSRTMYKVVTIQLYNYLYMFLYLELPK